MEKLILVLSIAASSALNSCLAHPVSEPTPVPVRTVAPLATLKPVTPAPVPEKTVATLSPTYPTPSAGSPPGCMLAHNPHDGPKRGFLAKVGEHTGKLTLIFPVALLPKGSHVFKKVSIYSGATLIDSPRYREALTVDRSNRPIYDGHKTSLQYPSRITVNADGNCYTFDPHTRVD